MEDIDKIIAVLRDAADNPELDCDVHELRPWLTKAADSLEELTRPTLSQSRRLAVQWQGKFERAEECIYDVDTYLMLGAYKQVRSVIDLYRKETGENVQEET
jgi:hypothetical protein